MTQRCHTMLVAILLFSLLGLGTATSGTPDRKKTVPLDKKKIVEPPDRAKTPARPTSFRTLLNKVPAGKQTKFLNSMIFNDGALAGAYIGDVKGSLSPGEFTAMMKSCGCNGWNEGWYCSITQGCIKLDGHMCNPDKCASQPKLTGLAAVQLGELKMPEAERQRFLNSLDFVNGRLVNASVEGAQSRLNKTDFQRLSRALGGNLGSVADKKGGVRKE